MNPTCPQCSLDDVMTAEDHYECATCGFEWPRERVVQDANGKVLENGDTVTLIKELKLKGAENLKIGTKA
jgi:protein PhnA